MDSKRLKDIQSDIESGDPYPLSNEVCAEMVATIEALQLQVKELKASRIPRPMEDAPKDGRTILVFDAPEGLRLNGWVQGWWNKQEEQWCKEPVDGDFLKPTMWVPAIPMAWTAEYGWEYAPEEEA